MQAHHQPICHPRIHNSKLHCFAVFSEKIVTEKAANEIPFHFVLVNPIQSYEINLKKVTSLKDGLFAVLERFNATGAGHNFKFLSLPYFLRVSGKSR